MYLLIAYRSSGSNYCRSCEMERWSSNIQQVNQLTKEKLIDLWAELMFEDTSEYGEYEFTIYKDGIKVFENGHTTWDHMETCPHEYQSDDYWEFEVKSDEECKVAMNEISEIQIATQSKFKILVDAARIRKENEENVKRQIREQKERDQRLKEFEKLKQEFGS